MRGEQLLELFVSRGYDVLMNDGRMRDAWREMERSNLEEARKASDAKTLSERAEEAVAWYLVTLAEIARRATNEEELNALMEPTEAPVNLAARWAKLHPG